MPTASASLGGTPNLTSQQALTQFGPILSVRVGFDRSFEPSHSLSPNLPEELLSALVDTGAGESCIDSDLAKALQLPRVDQRMVSGVGGEFKTSTYLAQIYVPALEITLYGGFAGVHLNSGGQPYSALLGRTFLQHFTMTYEGRTGVVLIGDDVPSAPAFLTRLASRVDAILGRACPLAGRRSSQGT